MHLLAYLTHTVWTSRVFLWTDRQTDAKHRQREGHSYCSELLYS